MSNISIVGVEGSGKTVLMSAICDKYSTADSSGVFMAPGNQDASKFRTINSNVLRTGRWPVATIVNKSLDWELYQEQRNDNPKIIGTLSFLDFAGELYRLIYGQHTKEKQEPYEDEIKQVTHHIKESDLLLVVINLTDLINGSAANERTIETKWITYSVIKNAALYKYTGSNKSKKEIAIVFTQADLYRDVIAECGGEVGILRKFLPDVYNMYRVCPIFSVAAVNKTVPDANGNQIPAADYASEGIDELMAWVLSKMPGYEAVMRESNVDAHEYVNDVDLSAKAHDKEDVWHTGCDGDVHADKLAQHRAQLLATLMAPTTNLVRLFARSSCKRTLYPQRRDDGLCKTVLPNAGSAEEDKVVTSNRKKKINHDKDSSAEAAVLDTRRVEGEKIVASNTKTETKVMSEETGSNDSSKDIAGGVIAAAKAAHEREEAERKELEAASLQAQAALLPQGREVAHPVNMKSNNGCVWALILTIIIGVFIWNGDREQAKQTRQVESERIEKVNRLTMNEFTPEEFAINGVKFEMVPIKAGSFMMGVSGNNQSVTLTKDFYMGKYEVTQEQWEAIMGGNPSRFKGVKRPVENVSWNDAQEFITKLNAQDAVKRSGMKFRLPTEAEWEYACRAGTTTAYSWGNALNGDKANCDGNYPHGTDVKGKYLKQTTDVGSYAPNAWGLYDMHGNVWEWCEDWYGDYSNGAVTDPKGAPGGSDRVLRGGSYVSNAAYCRSANRSCYVPTYVDNRIGFRLVLAPIGERGKASRREGRLVDA